MSQQPSVRLSAASLRARDAARTTTLIDERALESYVFSAIDSRSDKHRQSVQIPVSRLEDYGSIDRIISWLRAPPRCLDAELVVEKHRYYDSKIVEVSWALPEAQPRAPTTEPAAPAAVGATATPPAAAASSSSSAATKRPDDSEDASGPKKKVAPGEATATIAPAAAADSERRAPVVWSRHGVVDRLEPVGRFTFIDAYEDVSYEDIKAVKMPPNGMGHLYHENGRVFIICCEPSSGKKTPFTLDELYDMLQCRTVEFLPTPKKNIILIVDEEGVISGLKKRNDIASHAFDMELFGNVIRCDSRYFK